MIGWYYLFFFLSGLTALIYETTFAHQLHLVFGSTLSAATVVFAVYLGGMALGAAFLGSKADKLPALKYYGILEIGIGVLALAAVILVPGIRYIYASLASTFPIAGAGRTVVQSLLAVIVILPSTLLMGATLPALARGMTDSIDRRFKRIASLYGLNTLGAALGTLLCGFLLIEFLGYFQTVLAAMITNVIIGAVALRLSSRSAHNTSRSTEKADEAESTGVSMPGNGARLKVILLVMAGLSGLAALGYEVVWFRTLTFSVVADAYAFALMLGIYLLGIGIGSMAASWRVRKFRPEEDAESTAWLEIGILELAIAVLVVAGFAALIGLNDQLARPLTSDPGFWWKTLRNTAVQALVLVFPVTLLLGYIFPLLVSLYSSNLKRIGGQVGRVAAVNTAGSIAGILCSGFILIPLIGIQYTLFLLAGLSAAVGAAALIFGPIQRVPRTASLVVGIPAVIVALVLFPIRSHFGFLQIPTHGNADLLFYKESPDQTVIVTQDKGGRHIRRLLLNQQQATSTGLAGQRKNQLLGHLPLWACPDAENAMVICFGSGGTFGALGLYDLERVDCVEICPSVLEAAHFFSEWNGNVLSRSNVRVILDDGRSYLLTAKDHYDIITLEPMHPGLKGVASLYSREFYREARNRLKAGGVLCQWIPLYSMTGEDARSLMASAVEVFPNSSLWIVGMEGILLCAKDSLSIDGKWVKEGHFESDIEVALGRVLLDDPWAIFSGYLLGPQGLKEYTAGAPIMRDNWPFTEFTIPRHQYLHPWEDILKLGEIRESPVNLVNGLSADEKAALQDRWEKLKPTWIERDRGFAAYEQGEFKAAREHLERAHQGDPDDRYTAYFLKELYWRYGVEFSRRELWDQAITAYQRSVQIDEQDPNAHLYLAMAFENAGELDQSLSEVEAALKIEPDHPDALEFKSRISRNVPR